MNNTGIEWADFSFNPITGCTAASEGCANCYANAVADRFWGERKFSDVQFHPERLADAIKLNNKIKKGNGLYKTGKTPIVFLGSMTDLFQDRVYENWLDQIFDVVSQCSLINFLALTKRPEGMRRYFDNRDEVLPNLWLGTTIENQRVADRLPILATTVGAVKFLSVEPLLGEVNLEEKYLKQIDWVIVGGESGKGARKCDIKWIKSIVNQCHNVGVPVFVKQLGSVYKNHSDFNTFPTEIKYREWPKYDLEVL